MTVERNGMEWVSEPAVFGDECRRLLYSVGKDKTHWMEDLSSVFIVYPKSVYLFSRTVLVTWKRVN